MDCCLIFETCIDVPPGHNIKGSFVGLRSFPAGFIPYGRIVPDLFDCIFSFRMSMKLAIPSVRRRNAHVLKSICMLFPDNFLQYCGYLCTYFNFLHPVSVPSNKEMLLLLKPSKQYVSAA